MPNDYHGGSWWIQGQSSGDGGRCLADVTHTGSRPECEIEANARLIAAAPEMLEALYTALNLQMAVSKAVEYIPACEGLDAEYHFDKIRAAIAKATGEESQ
jgi:hypothetical protein